MCETSKNIRTDEDPLSIPGPVARDVLMQPCELISKLQASISNFNSSASSSPVWQLFVRVAITVVAM